MSVRPKTPMRCTAERDELVEQYLPLVRHVASRLAVTMPNSLDRDDFFSVGVMGLMHAAANYDPGRGASFKTFAFTAIRGAILDELRRHDPLSRGRRERLRQLDDVTSSLRAKLGRAPTIEELSAELDRDAESLDDDLLALQTSKMLSLDAATDGDSTLGWLEASLTDSSAVEPAEHASRGELVERLTAAIASLPENERTAVVLYYHEELYLKEIGEILGVTESRVSQILSRATARLQLKLKEN